MTKPCTDCKYFTWVADKAYPGGFPSLYKDGHPTCTHKDGWTGVQTLSIGYPLNVGWAREESASCGPNGNNFEAIP